MILANYSCEKFPFLFLVLCRCYIVIVSADWHTHDLLDDKHKNVDAKMSIKVKALDAGLLRELDRLKD